MLRISSTRRLASAAVWAAFFAASLAGAPAMAQGTASAGLAAPEAAGAGASVGGAPAASSAQPSASARSRRFLIGPEVGVFLPTDSKLRDRFGSAWFSIGVGIGQIAPATSPGQLGLDLNVIGRTGPGIHAYIAPLGVQYRIALARGGSSVPYIGASADIVFADIRSPADHAHSGLMETGGGSVFIGTTIGPRSYVEARYLALGSIQGFGLSGTNLTAGYRF